MLVLGLARIVPPAACPATVAAAPALFVVVGVFVLLHERRIKGSFVALMRQALKLAPPLAPEKGVMRLARERPEWVPVVRAALVLARRSASDGFPGDEFAGAWVLEELKKRGAARSWFPNLRLLVSYGVLEKSGPSTRQKQRAYYRMDDPDGVSRALQALGYPEWQPT